MTTLGQSQQSALLPTESQSTSSSEDSPAKTSPSRARAPVLLANEADYGLSSPESLARYDRSTSSWRTSQLCLVEGSARFSETWPRSGMTRSGTAYRLRPLVLLTEGTGSGLLPTPDTERGGKPGNGRQSGRSLVAMAKRGLLPTPRAAEWKGTGPLGSKSHLHRVSRGYLDATMQEATGRTGRLNPRFVEWMMGFEPGHTDFDVSAMPSSRKSSR